MGTRSYTRGRPGPPTSLTRHPSRERRRQGRRVLLVMVRRLRATKRLATAVRQTGYWKPPLVPLFQPLRLRVLFPVFQLVTPLTSRPSLPCPGPTECPETEVLRPPRTPPGPRVRHDTPSPETIPTQGSDLERGVGSGPTFLRLPRSDPLSGLSYLTSDSFPHDPMAVPCR